MNTSVSDKIFNNKVKLSKVFLIIITMELQSIKAQMVIILCLIIIVDNKPRIIIVDNQPSQDLLLFMLLLLLTINPAKIYYSFHYYC
jgi:hypothetical protein